MKMKKTLFFALILGLAVMFAVPASAFKIESPKETIFQFGAWIATDLGVWHRSKELWNGKNDNTQTILDLPRWSRVYGSLEVGDVGAYWDFRLGGNQQLSNLGIFPYANGYYFVETAKFYGWYTFGNCTILAGKTDGHVYSVLPYQILGWDNFFHMGGMGWGGIYDQRDTQVRFSQNVSRAFSYDISLVQPIYYQDNGTLTQGTPGAAAAVQSYASIPLLAAKLLINFTWLSLMPAGYIQYVKWDNLPATPLKTTPDDHMTSWTVVLPIVVKAGAFKGTFQGAYGENMGSRIPFAGGPLAVQSVYHGYGRTSAGAIKNTRGMNAFMDLAYTSGPFTPHFYLGWDKAQNSDIYVFGEDYNQRLMYGVSVNWKIANNFYLIPELTYYNYGKDPTKPKNPDLGTEWLGGVVFLFVF